MVMQGALFDPRQHSHVHLQQMQLTRQGNVVKLLQRRGNRGHLAPSLFDRSLLVQGEFHGRLVQFSGPQKTEPSSWSGTECWTQPYTSAQTPSARKAVAADLPSLALAVYHARAPKIRVGEFQLARGAGAQLAIMSPLTVIQLLGLAFTLLLHTSLVSSATVAHSLGIARTNLTLGSDDDGDCVTHEGWVGDGIARRDCVAAVREFYRTEVYPRGRNEFEFVSRGVRRKSYLPEVLLPLVSDYGKW